MSMNSIKREHMGRSDGLVGNVFAFGPGDPGLIPNLCVTSSFLPRPMRITTKGGPIHKVPTLWDKP